MTTLKVGDKAPSFKSIDQDGEEHNLSDYSGKKIAHYKIIADV